MISDGGQIIRMSVEDISFTGCSARGVTLFRTADGERVVSVTRLRDVEGEGIPYPISLKGHSHKGKHLSALKEGNDFKGLEKRYPAENISSEAVNLCKALTLPVTFCFQITKPTPLCIPNPRKSSYRHYAPLIYHFPTLLNGTEHPISSSGKDF